ncbi:MAG: PD40 domain-containing protein [Rhodoferax sp.]|nr:PD40 domain-containing protein [Rhodoferax sp.]
MTPSTHPPTRSIARAAMLLLAAAALTACQQNGDTRPSPPPGPRATPEQVIAYKTQAVAEIGVAPGWGKPELLLSVNTEGWEDSAYISPDGQSLYFQYFPGDMFRINDVFYFHRPKSEGGLGADPAQRDRYHRGPARGVSPAYTSDTLVAKREGDTFGAPVRFPHARDGRNEWGVMLGGDGAYYYVSHDETRELNMDIYRNAQLLAIPGREKYHEDNPHFAITPYGRELFFDSGNRPQAKGKSHIWVTRETGGRFAEPVMLPAPVNVKDSTEVQPHLTADGQLYFTSARDGTIAIYASQRTGADSWAEPRKVLWTTRKSGARAWGLGEPTLTADGQWLYFVVVFDNGRQEFDADIARVRRTDPAR